MDKVETNTKPKPDDSLQIQLRRNIPAGRRLLFDYAGPKGELTEFVQYSYCEKIFRAAGKERLADLFACVADCEAEHLRQLGTLIRALGVDPQYLVVQPNGQRRYWTAAYIQNSHNPAQQLRWALGLERAGIAGYRAHLPLLSGEAKETVSRIIEDEEYHIHLFEQAAKE